MSRPIVLAVVVVLGVAVGAGAVWVRSDRDGPGDRPPDAGGEADRDAPAAGGADAGPPPVQPREPADDDRLLLVWTPGGLPADLDHQLADIEAVTDHTVVGGDLVELAEARHATGRRATELDDGWVIPLDALAVDPTGYADVVGDEAVAELDDGEAVLGATSAGLRDLEPGAALTTAGGDELAVTGVADDDAVAAAEVVVTHATGQRLGITTERFALARYDGDRGDVERAVRAALPADTPARLRAPGETPYLRHGDAVLPQALIKDRFGEFAYQRRADGQLTLDRRWRDDHLATRDVPLVGEVRCHRAILADLTAALEALDQQGRDDLVDPDGYGGCYHPRLTRAGDAVSRHAWGIAVDLNVDDNPVGTPGTQDPRLIEALEAHGFAWGGEWLVPDPHHFEHVEHVDAAAP